MSPKDQGLFLGLVVKESKGACAILQGFRWFYMAAASVLFAFALMCIAQVLEKPKAN